MSHALSHLINNWNIFNSNTGQEGGDGPALSDKHPCSRTGGGRGGSRV